ncbi:cellulase family glycosylhydrolase [Chitinophagaceae bacterium 26-R-25]|nr:cellulase family glycosylhydrolase [Chitinophagaceae bacterium 26-R-25]
MHKRLALLITALLLAANFVFAQTNSFVRAKDGSFSVDNQPYYFVGTNYWYGSLLANDKHGKDRVIRELDFLVKNGVTNLRLLAGVEGEGFVNGVNRVAPALQKPQGVFNKDILKGLDFLLTEMGKRNMKAVIFLSNNWEWSGGFLQYLNWNGQIPDSIFHRKLNWDELRDNIGKFYTCDACMNAYKKQVEFVVNRTNTVTKKKYKDDAAIMAWELANEPRPMRESAIPSYEKWVSNAAAYIKSLDKNHLVTTGAEGYMGTENVDVFKAIHSDKNIDYATIHIWPKNWGWFKDTSIAASIDNVVKQTQTYIDVHAQAAKEVNKAMVVEEFGLPRDHHSYSLSASTTMRDQYYNVVLKALWNSEQNKGVIAGCNFWAFGGAGRPSGKDIFWQKGDDVLGDPPMEEQGLNSVFDSDATTWQLINSFTQKINGLNAKN